MVACDTSGSSERARGTACSVVSFEHERRAKLAFPDLPHGTYALFLFHDENDNGTVDHNLLGIPTEPLGFSGGFKVSLFSGVPDFDDLKFEFTAKSRPLAIVVE